MTLSKLSWRNAQRQARDYLVYFVTVVMAAALIYAFNGLVFSQEIAALSTQMRNLPLMIVLASLAVVAVVGWLVSYTTGFMLTRRSRELGTYLLIGLEPRQVARLFFLENLAVGAVALALGLVAGNLLYQVLRALVLALFGVTYHFAFAFSGKTVGLTLVYFAAIYLLALGRSRRKIRRMKIHDLLYLDRQNEGVVIQQRRRRQGTFVLSLVLGVAGALLLMAGGLVLGLIGGVCIVLFSFGFFVSFASGVPAFFARRPGLKYRGQTLLVFRTLTAKLATMGVLMATLSLLLTATFLLEGTGLTFQGMLRNRSEQASVFDLTIRYEVAQHGEGYRDFVAQEVPVAAQWDYPLRQGEGTQVSDHLAAETREYVPYFDFDLVLAQTDYNALRALKDLDPVDLGAGGYAIQCADYLWEELQGYAQPLSMAGHTLALTAVVGEPLANCLWESANFGYVLVVPDAVAAALPVECRTLAVMTTQPLSQETFQALRQVQRQYNQADPDYYDSVASRVDREEEYAATSTMTVFPLFYLALVLTLTAAAILTVQQLSETARYRQQFTLLHKLGMDRREMVQALRRQFAIYYTMPAVPPVLIGVPFTLNLGQGVEPGTMVGQYRPDLLALLTLALFFAIYLLYILLAYHSLKRNVLPEA